MSGWRDEDGIYANGVDIDRLLEQILSDPRLRSSKAFSTTKTYADAPIIRRGLQMDSYLPKEIGQMRELQRTPHGRTWSDVYKRQGQGQRGPRPPARVPGQSGF